MKLKVNGEEVVNKQKLTTDFKPELKMFGTTIIGGSALLVTNNYFPMATPPFITESVMIGTGIVVLSMILSMIVKGAKAAFITR